MPTPPLELVIFDCDGVLVDSERISNRVLARMLTSIGLPTTPRESMDVYMGSTLAGCAELIERNLGRPLPEHFMDDYLAARMAALEEELVPVPGVEAALDAIAARGLATCVASSNARRVTRELLRIAGLLDRFGDRIFSASEDVARGKPHPDVFLHAAAAHGVAPGVCAVVEDSPRGAQGGVAAAMPTFGFARDVPAEALRRLGAHPFAEMAELPGLLARLGRRAARA